jgi:hypothetical protein
VQVVRYKEAGSTEPVGHTQMKMGGGKYFDSVQGKGPTISTKSVMDQLKPGETVVSTEYLRPKQDK